MIGAVPTRHRPLVRALLVIRLAVAGSLGVVACASDEPAGDAERFCTEIEANRVTLADPDLTSSDDIAPLLTLYRDIGEFAPLAIETEWDQVTLNYETASTVVPGDDDSVQIAVAMALRSEKSAIAVSEWLDANCGVDLGPIATVAPQGS